MGDSPRRPDETPAFDPRATPLPRRRMLTLMGASALLAGGLGAVLEACVGPPVTVRLDIDLDSLVPGTPREVPFTVLMGDRSVPGSTWLVRQASDELVAFDPRCTHGLCRYDWLAEGARFRCRCHEGEFGVDGTVLAGPPPRPLARLPLRVVGGGIEVDVPGNFETPRESLPT